MRLHGRFADIVHVLLRVPHVRMEAADRVAASMAIKTFADHCHRRLSSRASIDTNGVESFVGIDGAT
jgi:hypothetical protein